MSIGRLLLALAALFVLGLIAIPLFYGFREMDLARKRVLVGFCGGALVVSMIGVTLWAVRPIVPGGIDYRGTPYCRDDSCFGDPGTLRCASQLGLRSDLPLHRIGRLSWVFFDGDGHVGSLPPWGMLVYGTSNVGPGSVDSALYVAAGPNCLVTFHYGGPSG
ncbi:MAG TPA: hypothetical protein DIT48_11550 [Actinobacteria bacterium]|jgi:hypothetical protein|nr:hypothetical protein [Actinomycetota bacterium]HCP61672.1 hypothetical protein [Actinomycetota bacterium]